MSLKLRDASLSESWSDFSRKPRTSFLIRFLFTKQARRVWANGFGWQCRRLLRLQQLIRDWGHRGSFVPVEYFQSASGSPWSIASNLTSLSSLPLRISVAGQLTGGGARAPEHSLLRGIRRPGQSPKNNQAAGARRAKGGRIPCRKLQLAA